MDVMPSRYGSWKDLKRYCYLVASTVGMLSLPIIRLTPGVNPDLAAAYAVKLGVALQLTNILRDLGEDAGRGRSSSTGPSYPNRPVT
jgi:phytoene synthase